MSIARTAKTFCTLALILTMTAACFSRNTPAPTTDTPSEIVELDPTATATMPNVAESSSSELQANSTADVGKVQVIEEIASIERYRMHITMKSTVANRNTNIQVDAAYIKEPPAEEVTMQVDENGETQTMSMFLVDGLRYMRSGEMVVQTADAQMNLQELTLIQPRDVAGLDGRFMIIGEESVNGRTTIHYQGGPEAVPTGGTAGDTFDVTALESAGIDLWIDQAENFIVAMEVNVAGFDEEPDARMQMRFEYADFNSPDILIEAPADAMAMPGGMAAGADTDSPPAAEEDAPEPRNALGKLLGFDLLIATGSEITLVSNQIVQVSSVYTLDEAVNLFQTQLPANGYTFMNLITPQAGESVVMFQKGLQIATLQITETDKGSDWTVVMAP